MPNSSRKTKREQDRAIELFENAVFVNANDSTTPVPDFRAKGWPVRNAWKFHFDNQYCQLLTDGRVTAIQVGQLICFDDDMRKSIERISHLFTLVETHKNALMLATKPEHVLDAQAAGKTAMIMFFQNSSPLENDLKLLQVFHKLGVRAMQATYNHRNSIGYGCCEKKDKGLSAFGVKWVDEMNKTGMVIDIAHAGQKTLADIVDQSRDPVVLSHGCAYSITPHVRNTRDEQIHALADKGGVFGVVAKPFALRSNGAREGASIENYLDNIDYISRLVGISHVGIGLDLGYKRSRDEIETYHKYFPEYDWTGPNFETYYHVKGMMDPSTIKLDLIEGLISRGYSDQEIRSIMGENFLRIYKKVWK